MRVVSAEGSRPPPETGLLGASGRFLAGSVVLGRGFGAKGSNTRKPWFLDSSLGSLWFRYADRTFCGSFQ